MHGLYIIYVYFVNMVYIYIYIYIFICTYILYRKWDMYGPLGMIW